MLARCAPRAPGDGYDKPMAGYVFTPARRAALRKAQLASAKARKGRKISSTRRIYGQTTNRPSGISGLRRTVTPYARANKRSQTVGFNAGTILPATRKRIAFGAYVRLESTTRRTATDRAISKASSRIAPRNSKRGKVAGWFKNNVSVKNPALRASAGGAQVRLGTSRGAGPTVIVRRGAHKTPQKVSQKGILSYNKTTKKIAKPRPQRRRARK